MTAAEDSLSVISTTVTGTTSAPNSAYADFNYDRRVICGCAGVNRFFILILVLFFLSFCMSSLICYDATFVAIKDKKTSLLYNGTISHDIDWASSELPIGQRRLSYGVLEKSLTFAGGFVGSTALTFPMNLLLSRFGAHKSTTISITFPVAGAIVNDWASTQERGTFVAVVQLGSNSQPCLQCQSVVP